MSTSHDSAGSLHVCHYQWILARILRSFEGVVLANRARDKIILSMVHAWFHLTPRRRSKPESYNRRTILLLHQHARLPT